jgi:hypothetical protein
LRHILDIITDYSRATNRDFKSTLVPANGRRPPNGARRQPAAAGAGAG